MHKTPLLLILLLPACGRDPIAPGANLLPTFAATTDWSRGVMFLDFPGIPIACRGENHHFFGETPYRQLEVTDASGGYHYRFQFAPVTPNDAPYLSVGETSGQVFVYKNGLPINETLQLGPGEVYVYNDREMYVAENGDKLTVSLRIHVTVNANGDLVVDRATFEDFVCESK